MGDVSIGPSVCYKVDKIIGMSVGEGNVRNYQVQWSPLWISSVHLVGCENLIEEFINLQTKDALITTSTSTETVGADGYDEDMTTPAGLYDEETTQADCYAEDTRQYQQDNNKPYIDLSENTDAFHETRHSTQPLSPVNQENNDLGYGEGMTSDDVQVILQLDRENDNIRTACQSDDEVNPNFEWIENNLLSCQDSSAGGEIMEKIAGQQKLSGIQRDIDSITDNPDTLSSSGPGVEDLCTEPNKTNFTVEECEAASGSSSYSMKAERDDHDIVLVEPSFESEDHNIDHHHPPQHHQQQKQQQQQKQRQHY